MLLWMLGQVVRIQCNATRVRYICHKGPPSARASAHVHRETPPPTFGLFQGNQADNWSEPFLSQATADRPPPHAGDRSGRCKADPGIPTQKPKARILVARTRPKQGRSRPSPAAGKPKPTWPTAPTSRPPRQAPGPSRAFPSRPGYATALETFALLWLLWKFTGPLGQGVLESNARNSPDQLPKMCWNAKFWEPALSQLPLVPPTRTTQIQFAILIHSRPMSLYRRE